MNLKPIMRLLCHQREDRTYKVCNTYLLVCGRCLGIYLGFFFSFIILIVIYGLFTKSVNVLYAFSLLIPMAIDGLTQAFGLRESKNWIRFITGYLAGLGVAYIFYALLSVIFIQQRSTLLPNFEIIPTIIIMLFSLFVLEKSTDSKNIFLGKFFNSIAIFSAAFLILGVIFLYTLILLRLKFF